jgi:hypothetical protein
VFHTSSGGQFPLATLGASRLSFTGTLALAEMFLCADELRAGYVYRGGCSRDRGAELAKVGGCVVPRVPKVGPVAYRSGSFPTWKPSRREPRIRSPTTMMSRLRGLSEANGRPSHQSTATSVDTFAIMYSRSAVYVIGGVPVRPVVCT